MYMIRPCTCNFLSYSETMLRFRASGDNVRQSSSYPAVTQHRRPSSARADRRLYERYVFIFLLMLGGEPFAL